MKIKENKLAEEIIGGAVSLTVATLAVKLLGVLYKIPLANILGDEGMGYFNSAYTVYAFFYLLCTAGVPKSVMILISEKLAQGKGDSVKKIVYISVKCFLLIGFTVSISLAGFAVPLSTFIGSEKSYVTMICVAPSIIFASVSGVLRGFLSAKMKMWQVAVSQVVEGAIKLSLGLCLAMGASGLGLELPIISAAAILGATLGSLFGLLYLFNASKSEFLNENIGQSNERIKTKDIISRIYKVSLPITLSAALMSLSGMVDLFLVMRRLESIGYTAREATALYGNYSTLALSMFNLALSVITPISVAFLPALTKARTAGDFQSFDNGVESGMSLTAIVTAPITVGMAVYSFEILSFLFGAEAAAVGAPLLVLICPGVFFMSNLLLLNSALEALGRAGLAALSMVVGVLIKIIISGILLGNPMFGISGAPIGSVISYAVSAFLSLIILSHILGYNPPLFAASCLPYLLSSISVLASRLIYDRMIQSLNFSISLILSIISAALIYIALSAFCGSFNKQKFSKMAKLTNLT